MQQLMFFILVYSWFIVGNPILAQTVKIKQLKTEQTKLKGKINKQEKELQKNRSNVRKELQTLNRLNVDISKQNQVLVQIKLGLDTLQGSIHKLEILHKELQQDLDLCKIRYKKSILYMYRNRHKQEQLVFIFSAEDFRQMYRRIRYMTEYAKYQKIQGEIIQRKEEKVLELKQKLDATKRQKYVLLAQEETEKKELERQQKERKNVVTQLEKQQKQLQIIIASDKKKYNQLNATIEQLIQKEIAAAERKRKEEERQRKLAEQRKIEIVKGKERKETYPKNAKVQIAESKDYQLSNNFQSNKGRLPVPISGTYRITSSYGSNTVEGLKGVVLDNKGINLTGEKGAVARSIFDGEVSAVFSFGGVMNVLIRHGKYISVYCNLSSCSVRKGQQVKARQTLGNVASDGLGGKTLHFQLRKETEKLNPLAWIAK